MLFNETLQCPVGRQGFHNIKAAVMRDQKIVLEIIQKVCNTGKALAFHHNKRPDFGVIGITFTTCRSNIFRQYG